MIEKKYAIYVTEKLADIREIKIASILDIEYIPNTKINSWYLCTGTKHIDEENIIPTLDNQPKFLNWYDNMDYITIWKNEESAQKYLDNLLNSNKGNCPDGIKETNIHNVSFVHLEKTKGDWRNYKFIVTEITETWDEFIKNKEIVRKRKFDENINRLKKQGNSYDRNYTFKIKDMIKPHSRLVFNSEDYWNPNRDLRDKIIVKPSVIFSDDFSSFDELLPYRDKIRDLELVPIKSDEMHKKYHLVDKFELIASIDFKNSNIIYMENQFPYLLPKDTSQNLIWIKEGTPEDDVIKFVENKVREFGINEVIIFERQLDITTPLVKPSFPFIRHIHFWHKK